MIWRKKTHCSSLANSFLFSLFNARYLLLKATEIFFRAKSFSPRKVVFFFNSSNGMISNSFARHSSANELDTTFTPSKSRTTCPSPRSRGSSLFLVSSPNLRVPRFSPTVINLNVVILLYQRLSISSPSRNSSLNSDSASVLFSKTLFGSISLSEHNSKYIIVPCQKSAHSTYSLFPSDIRICPPECNLNNIPA